MWIFLESGYLLKVDSFEKWVLSRNGYLQKVDSFKKWTFPKNIKSSKMPVTKSGYLDSGYFRKDDYFQKCKAY